MISADRWNFSEWMLIIYQYNLIFKIQSFHSKLFFDKIICKILFDLFIFALLLICVKLWTIGLALFLNFIHCQII